MDRGEEALLALLKKGDFTTEGPVRDVLDDEEGQERATTVASRDNLQHCDTQEMPSSNGDQKNGCERVSAKHKDVHVVPSFRNGYGPIKIVPRNDIDKPLRSKQGDRSTSGYRSGHSGIVKDGQKKRHRGRKTNMKKKMHKKKKKYVSKGLDYSEEKLYDDSYVRRNLDSRISSRKISPDVIKSSKQESKEHRALPDNKIAIKEVSVKEGVTRLNRARKGQAHHRETATTGKHKQRLNIAHIIPEKKIFRPTTQGPGNFIHKSVRNIENGNSHIEKTENKPNFANSNGGRKPNTIFFHVNDNRITIKPDGMQSTQKNYQENNYSGELSEIHLDDKEVSSLKPIKHHKRVRDDPLIRILKKTKEKNIRMESRPNSTSHNRNKKNYSLVKPSKKQKRLKQMSLDSRRFNDKVKLFEMSPGDPLEDSKDIKIGESERKVEVDRNTIVGIRARQNPQTRKQQASFDKVFDHIENYKVKDLSHNELVKKERKFDHNDLNTFVANRNKVFINQTESSETTPGRLKTRNGTNKKENKNTSHHEKLTLYQGRQQVKYFPAKNKTKPAENIEEVQSVVNKGNTESNTVSNIRKINNAENTSYPPNYSLEKALRHAELTWSRDPFRNLNISPRTPVFDIDFSKNPAEKRKKKAAKDLSKHVLPSQPNHNIIKTFSNEKTRPVKHTYHNKKKQSASRILQRDKFKFSIEDFTWTPALLRRKILNKEY